MYPPFSVLYSLYFFTSFLFIFHHPRLSPTTSFPLCLSFLISFSLFPFSFVPLSCLKLCRLRFCPPYFSFFRPPFFVSLLVSLPLFSFSFVPLFRLSFLDSLSSLPSLSSFVFFFFRPPYLSRPTSSPVPRLPSFV